MLDLKRAANGGLWPLVALYSAIGGIVLFAACHQPKPELGPVGIPTGAPVNPEFNVNPETDRCAKATAALEKANGLPRGMLKQAEDACRLEFQLSDRNHV